MNAEKITEQQLQAIESQSGSTVIDFYAGWCAPCTRQSRILEAYPENGWKLVALDLDKADRAAQKYGIMAVPTLVFLKDGAVQKQVSGVQDAAALDKLFRELGTN